MSRADEFIETYTGGRFYPFDPRPEDVRLADIAGGLAHTCRFGGHCRWFYSVAHHSLLVRREVADRPPRVQAYALLHDAAEAYLGDVPRPIKPELAGYDRAEADIRAAVWTALDLPPPADEEWATVTRADDRLLAYEADQLLADGSWAADPPDLEYELSGRSVGEVRAAFRERAEALLERV